MRTTCCFFIFQGEVPAVIFFHESVYVRFILMILTQQSNISYMIYIYIYICHFKQPHTTSLPSKNAGFIHKLATAQNKA